MSISNDKNKQHGKNNSWNYFNDGSRDWKNFGKDSSAEKTVDMKGLDVNNLSKIDTSVISESGYLPLRIKPEPTTLEEEKLKLNKVALCLTIGILIFCIVVSAIACHEIIKYNSYNYNTSLSSHQRAVSKAASDEVNNFYNLKSKYTNVKSLEEYIAKYQALTSYRNEIEANPDFINYYNGERSEEYSSLLALVDDEIDSTKNSIKKLVDKVGSSLTYDKSLFSDDGSIKEDAVLEESSVYEDAIAKLTSSMNILLDAKVKADAIDQDLVNSKMDEITDKFNKYKLLLAEAIKRETNKSVTDDLTKKWDEEFTQKKQEIYDTAKSDADKEASASYQNQINSLNTDISSLKSDNKRLTDEVSSKQKEIEDLKTKLEAANKQ